MKKVLNWVCTLLLLGMVCFPVIQSHESSATVTLITNSFSQHRLGLSSDTKPTLTTSQIGATFRETDTGNFYVWNGSAWNNVMPTSSSAIDTLTAGATSSTARATAGFNEATFDVIVRGAAAVNVSFTLQGRNTSDGWKNLDSLNDSTTSTAADTIGLSYAECASIDSIRAWAFNISASESLFVCSKMAKTQPVGK